MTRYCISTNSEASKGSSTSAPDLNPYSQSTSDFVEIESPISRPEGPELQFPTLPKGGNTDQETPSLARSTRRPSLCTTITSSIQKGVEIHSPAEGDKIAASKADQSHEDSSTAPTVSDKNDSTKLALVNPIGNGLPPGATPIYYTHDGTPFVLLGGAPAPIEAAEKTTKSQDVSAEVLNNDTKPEIPIDASERSRPNRSITDQAIAPQAAPDIARPHRVPFLQRDNSDTNLQKALRQSRLEVTPSKLQDDAVIDRSVQGTSSKQVLQDSRGSAKSHGSRYPQSNEYAPECYTALRQSRRAAQSSKLIEKWDEQIEELLEGRAKKVSFFEESHHPDNSRASEPWMKEADLGSPAPRRDNFTSDANTRRDRSKDAATRRNAPLSSQPTPSTRDIPRHLRNTSTSKSNHDDNSEDSFNDKDLTLTSCYNTYQPSHAHHSFQPPHHGPSRRPSTSYPHPRHLRPIPTTKFMAQWVPGDDLDIVNSRTGANEDNNNVDYGSARRYRRNPYNVGVYDSGCCDNTDEHSGDHVRRRRRVEFHGGDLLDEPMTEDDVRRAHGYHSRTQVLEDDNDDEYTDW